MGEKLSESGASEGDEKAAAAEFKLRLVWFNIVGLALLHTGAVIGLYLALASAKLVTVLFAFFLYLATGFGTAGGAHRLWSHRSFKAKWPLRLMLMIFQQMAFQDSVFAWARNHRVHHKYSDTTADPHNIHRGFFFAHVGWLLSRKHPDVTIKGKRVDFSDLENDPIVAFQRKYYYPLFLLVTVGLPSALPVYLWSESWLNSFFVPFILRYVIWLNVTLSINSFAHRYGSKPFDRYMYPTDNKIFSFFSLGEGWHNYHHTFPWDYRIDEFGDNAFDLTTTFIQFFEKIGWAYDLKTTSKQMIMKRVQRTGDGSHPIWGWGDRDQTEEEKTEVLRRLESNDKEYDY